MREAGLVVARTLQVLAEAVRPGITTADLDALAEAEIRAAGATPSFKGYHGYPATICTSVNEEIVHGIPSPAAEPAGRGHHLHRLRRHRRRVARGRGPHRRRGRHLRRACRPARRRARPRCGGGWPRPRPAAGSVTSRTRWRPACAPRAATAWSRSTPATASAARCTWTRRCPTTGGAGRGPRLRPGMALAIEPMVMLGGAGDGAARRRVDGHHRRRKLGRALRAHGRDHPRRALGADGRGRRDVRDIAGLPTCPRAKEYVLGDTRKRDPASIPPT